jgi:hypothetical protein
MSPPDPLESRNLSTGIAKRTLTNLDFIKQAYAQGKDVHVVMQTVNSLLGLLMFPVEKETEFFGALESVSLEDPPNFQAVRQSLPEFPLLPSLKIFQFHNCGNLSKFFKRLRNAIAHRRLKFSNDSRDPAAETITMQDRLAARRKCVTRHNLKRFPNDKPIDWEISISGEDLERLSRYIAHRVIAENL